jgi:hypothetical protein
MKNKISLYLQKFHQIKLENFPVLFPKCTVLLEKRGLLTKEIIGVNTCFSDLTPNIILFSDIRKKTTQFPIEALTEKEAMLLFDLIKKSE